jgi:Leucine-rich repeat (LRR) protein
MDIPIKNQIQSLKTMQKYPRFYLANYFDDLKKEVDLIFTQNVEENDLNYLQLIEVIKPFNKFFEQEKENYLEIISIIESFEQDSYYKIKPFNTFDNEINQLTSLDNHLIDEIKYKIEKTLFSNKSIMFIKGYEYKLHYYRQTDWKNFLLLINDEYLRKTTIDDEKIDNFNREKLIAYFLEQKLNEVYDNIKNFVSLNIKIEDIMLIDMSRRNNNCNINPFAINGLGKIKFICFNNNENQIIKEIHSDTFNGLTRLEEIYFSFNQIKELNSNIFSGLTCLKIIDFKNNQIKELNPLIFSGLINLEKIDFEVNQIKEIHSSTFKGLVNLKLINFYSNILKEIHPATFNGLKSLEEINFGWNQIKEIHMCTFNGLTSLKIVDLKYNQIKEIHPSTFNGLKNVKYLGLDIKLKEENRNDNCSLL